MQDPPPGPTSPESGAEPRWQPLEKVDRRVLGVLVEKAKTTPENYPLSLNGIVQGANQKSNRSPQMQLDADRVEEAADRLRSFGAIALIQGDGRVDKFRHLAYQWMGVDKQELAVMAELLLRGEQTIGQLRSRAARMEPIDGISQLRPILDRLHAKGLLEYLTPMGRGCLVTHTLFQSEEMDKRRRQHHAGQEASTPVAPAPAAFPDRAPQEQPLSQPHPDQTSSRDRSSNSPAAADQADEVQSLRAAVGSLRAQLTDLREQFESTTGQLQHELDDLKQQLGV
jgi:uncharacterized protein